MNELPWVVELSVSGEAWYAIAAFAEQGEASEYAKTWTRPIHRTQVRDTRLDAREVPTAPFACDADVKPTNWTADVGDMLANKARVTATVPPTPHRMVYRDQYGEHVLLDADAVRAIVREEIAAFGDRLSGRIVGGRLASGALADAIEYASGAAIEIRK